MTDSAPHFPRYFSAPFIDCFPPGLHKFTPASPHPPISSSSGSSSPHHDDIDTSPPASHPPPEAAVESPASSSYSSRSDEEAPSPGGLLVHLGSKRRKQHKPIRCDALNLSKETVLEDHRDSDSGVHDGSPAAVDSELQWKEEDVDAEEVDRERQFSSELDGLRIGPGGESRGGSSPGSTSPNGRRIPVLTGNRVFPVAPTGARIFNPDAYCTLCSREFCNKYFLKTHKANKHGVYEPDDPSPPPGALPGTPGGPPPQPGFFKPEETTPGLVQTEGDTPAADMERQLLTNQIRLMYAQNFAMQQLLQRGGPVFPMMPPFGQPLMPMMPPLGGAAFFPRPPPEMMPPTPEVPVKREEVPPEVPGTEEVVCEVCQKRLSSRSFLRIHMKRKHGMEGGPRSPLGAGEPKKRSRKKERKETVQERADAFLKRSGIAMPNGSVKEEERENNGYLQQLLLSIRDPGSHGRRETFRCPQCPTDFASPYFLHCHLLKEHHHPRGAPAEPPPPYRSPEPVVLDLSTKSHSRPSLPSTQPPPLPDIVSSSTGQASLTTPIDLESFCVKCNREYCSKYFLRTHLKKVHSMTQEDYLAEVQTARPEVWRQFVSGEVPGAQEAGSGATASPGVRRNWCKHCKKDFCNKYFFKTHMMKMHGEEVHELVTSSRSARRRSQSVSCDVCHKDLCSKYFLKIHKKNAHNIHDPSLSMGVGTELETPGSPSLGDEDADPEMEEGEVDESMPLSMVMDLATPHGDHHRGSGAGSPPVTFKRDAGRATVITCVGTHFVPPLDGGGAEEEEPMIKQEIN
ncbi:SH3 and multiple ankyrin repeat domains protein 1-like [Paramacrobiotus metropolitanus]|uniref:SH3 and multiple ankyrin repeat domains protein 1-like n=1 Tax=Paramacrobiotus metropolitanus TaxID=2943436 RepID=UPI002445BF4E|nr:SH3 and multiple ankyrin repeat domains protein 1-like [Paramacrobiotus metropolitanus]XP_055350852.1 SH3 and multiple ankyrin repeat domains protein 1-like [Paramacrobiotus metropolitanus]XP_055350853.1 SH3 and multiple ankyrin repeat domains protein 1-like [Paramacrobiotus metropolitanus]